MRYLLLYNLIYLEEDILRQENFFKFNKYQFISNSSINRILIKIFQYGNYHLKTIYLK